MKHLSRIAPNIAEQATVVEWEHAHWIAAHASVPGVEVHVESDAVWMIQPGPAWSNAVVQLRFTPGTVEQRLDRLANRYRATGRGVGFWVSRSATPEDLPAQLRERGFRCRKHFPAMYCDLHARARSEVDRTDFTFEVVKDHNIFTAHAHPYFGPMRSPMRRFELARLMHLSALLPKRVWDLVALRQGVPVGACTLFLDRKIVGFHDVGVLPNARGQGIGTALMLHACEFARQLGAVGAVLIASAMGYGVYVRAGFAEVGRIGYWYRRYGGF